MNYINCDFGVLSYIPIRYYDDSGIECERRHYVLDSKSIKPFYPGNDSINKIEKEKVKASFNRAYRDAFKNDYDETTYDSPEKFKAIYGKLLREVNQLLEIETLVTSNYRQSDSQMDFFVNFLMNRVAHNALEIIIDRIDRNIDISYDSEEYDDEYPDVIYAKLNNIETVVHSTKHFCQLLFVDSDDKRYRPEYTILIRIFPAVAEELEKWLSTIVDFLNEAKSSTPGDFAQEIERKIAFYKTNRNSRLADLKVIRGKVKEYKAISCEKSKVLYDSLIKERESAELEYWRCINGPRILNKLKYEVSSYWNPSRKDIQYSLRQRILFDFTASENWCFDCPGYVSRSDIKSFSEDGKHGIFVGDVIGKSKPFNRGAYYARAVDLRDIASIKDVLPSGLLNLEA